MMRVYLGSDHAGFDLKNHIIEHLEDADVAMLARIFSKLAPPDADACAASTLEDQLADR